jgi:glutamyl-tRNA reductase
MHLVFVGMSYRSAPVELREHAHFGPNAGALLAGRLAGPDGEAVALATCNRTELYLVHEDASVAVARARAELGSRCRLAEPDLQRALAVSVNGEAARHLFRVAAGLDSMALGETQILGQVRRAYETARAAGATGLVLDRAFPQALHVGRRVRNEAAVGDLGLSLAAAAVDLLDSVVDLKGRRVLVLGAGKTARLATVALRARSPQQISVANRTPKRAKGLARRLGVKSLSFECISEELARADVVIASTSSPAFVVGAGSVRSAMRRREGRELVFVDLGVPRNVDPMVAAIPGCQLLGIDEVAAVLRETLAGKQEDLMRAELLVADETQKFSAWQRSRGAVDAIRTLRRRAEQLRLAELERAHYSLAGLSTRDEKIVESLTAQIVNRLLHAPTVMLTGRVAAAPKTQIES